MDLIGTLVPATIAVVALAGGIVLLYRLTRSILNIIAFVIVLALAYGGYLYLTGQRVPFTKDEIIEHAREKADIVKDGRGIQIMKDAVNRAGRATDQAKEPGR